ncbi:M13-type metalloendopeptidase [Mycoplasmopsis meleagridis]|uniref:M13-type metalloendopeptidase n=1 Tax=Mycoplasmopsis meleagridis TaxID=29561 RepID=UPI003A87A576
MNKKLLKDNFYKAVNEKWLKEAKIPSDKSSYGAFSEISKRNNKRLMKLARDLLTNYNKIEDQTLINFAKLYKQTTDYEKRDKLALKPLKKYLERITNITSLKDYIEKLPELILDGYPSVLDFFVYSDFANSKNQILYLSHASILLPDISYYDEKNPQKAILIQAYQKMMFKLLTKLGYKDKKSEQIIEKMLAFDELLAKYYPSNLERADYIKMYNLYDIDKVNSYSKNFDFKLIAETLVKNKVESLSVTYPRFLENFDIILNADNFENYKAWMLVKLIENSTAYLDNETRLIGNEFNKVLSGIKKSSIKSKAAFNLAYNYFTIPFGTYYAKKYFGQDAKKDVENKVNKMINVYAKRLKNNTWLSKPTIEKALLKLKNLGVHIGYPNVIQPYYASYEVKNYSEGFTLLDNVFSIHKVKIAYDFSQYNQLVNKNHWSMSPALVNAYYSPTMNHIVFPAGILDKPFYSLKQSSSANYGGIGGVIAHEISHAFDNHGAQFDENGNKKMWWTDEDFAKFTDLGKKMVELFNGEESGFGPCDGELTLSENIADGGGISCALETSMSEEKHSSKDFFESWATIWRQISSENYAKMLLKIDVHAPNILRANLQVKNLEEFYKTYDIKEEDKMYLPKEKRVNIW